MRKRWLVNSFILLLIIAYQFCIRGQSPVHASTTKFDFCYTDYEWQELDMASFVLLFPVEQTEMAQMIFSEYSTNLNSLISKYQTVFGTSLVLPVAIRIYPSQADYYCVNPLAPKVGTQTTHAHVGEREIALFADLFERDSDFSQIDILNGLRDELAILFAAQLSGGYAPRGLLIGLGLYAEDPKVMVPRHLELAGDLIQPDLSWNMIWEGSAEIQADGYFLQAASTVAYLIDVHGWGKFTEFLNQISFHLGYRQAFLEVYGVNFQEIQSHWQEYFPIYIEHRWQANIFHNFDLDVYQELISLGTYAESIPGLSEAVELIALFGDQEQLNTAQQLLTQAQIGAEAGELAAQSRYALLSGRYLESYTSAQLALENYTQIGDTRRLKEIQAYITVSKEVLDLRTGLEAIRERGIGINPLKSQKVYNIGKRLFELGDSEGVDQAELILYALLTGKNTFFHLLISLVILVSIGLIYRRVRSYHEGPPPEADLL